MNESETAAARLAEKPMKYLEDYVPGDVVEVAASYLITEEEILEVGKRWDPQPFHTDREAAAESFFGGLVASSVHLFAASVWLGYQMETRTAAVTALGFSELSWHAPARPGHRLSLRAETLSARESKSRPDCGVVENKSQIFNQDGELVFSFIGAALIRKRPHDETS
jgi:acyl dehydratase